MRMTGISPLNRKLLRELWRMRGQVLALSLVVASGMAVLIMSLSAVEALNDTAAAYYERYRFAHVFATVKRAPQPLVERIARIDGVESVEARIVRFATLSIAGFAEPVLGKLVSIPEGGEPLLNGLALREGRLVAAGRPDEAVLNAPFADAHGLKPGDRLDAVINGHRRSLTVVGVAQSPEFVYNLGPGALMPDNLRYGVLWLGRKALAAAFDLDGAMNDVTLLLLRGASVDEVIARLDALLDRYGGTGAYARKDQISNWFLMNEIAQLKTLATILPTIFLVVSAFLSNMVLSRLIAVERAEIGLLKAFGYGQLEIGWHYVKLAAAMTLPGVALGWAAGYAFGRFVTQIYTQFFSFPFLYFRPGPTVFLLAAAIGLAAALTGALGAAGRAASLPPAEAMRPPAPALYRKARLVHDGMAGWLDQQTRIVLRQIVRWPLRAFLTAAGVGLAVGLLVVALQWNDAINRMVEVYFNQTQRQDITVGLAEARGDDVVHAFAHLPGVMDVEPTRVLAARLRQGTRMHRQAIIGIRSDARLWPIYDSSGRVVEVPPAGLVLSTKLAEILAVAPGDEVTVEVLEGSRPVRRVAVAALFDTYIGTPAYMDLDAMARLLRQRPTANLVQLRVDPRRQADLFRRLREVPQVSSVTLRRGAIDTFRATMGDTILIYVTIFAGFACALVFGVVYNAARIALSERGRELATLRVLGFTRGEISYILLGEMAFLVAFALPLGCLAGYALAWLITRSFDTELFRVPFYMQPDTFGWAMLIGLAAALVSGAVVRRRVDRLDLIAVLKERE